MDRPIPIDARTWLAMWEATLRDRDNDQLACVAGQLLHDILADRDVKPGTQRPCPPPHGV